MPGCTPISGCNVAGLNERAHEWMADTGRLVGPEVHGFRAGDRVVATAPIPGLMVTSEKATVAAVQERHGMVDLWTDDGRIVRLEGAHVDRVALGYATTVHRAQGATVDPAHVFADGGGRELGYVEMSRARGRTQVYCVADDRAQAVDDLRREWGHERMQGYAIDLPTTEQARQPAAGFQAERASGRPT